MEYAILTTQKSDIHNLTEAFRRAIVPELDHDGLGLSFDRPSKDGGAALFVFESLRYLFLARTNVTYVATILFESDRDGRCKVTILVTGGPGGSGASTDDELKVLNSIKNPIQKIEEGVNTFYDGAWVYDDDDAVRQKAISSLEQIGGDKSIDKIIDILKHDSSDTVLNTALLSLGHMGSDRAIDPIMKTASKKSSLVATCARALGELRSPKAIEALKELSSLCDQKKLEAEAKIVHQAIQRAKLGDSYEEVLCTICNQPIEEDEEEVRCPYCSNMAHKTHMLEYLHVHGKCPSCGHSLTESKLEQVARGNLQKLGTARKQ
jgi:predicted RNA-binding Zn-ribbon protein involved in translation (DUF1610 family)